jgi:prepilin-type N-terminal cleavage/methylation domain-containing protein
MPTKSILNIKGFSVIELLVVMGILLILATSILIYTNPVENRQKARDQRRLTDIAQLREAFEEFKADNKVYPDIKDTVRYSNVSVVVDGDISSATQGWLGENLSGYLNFLPTDPINSGEYIYTYVRDDLSFELDCKLEYYTETMTGDNGDDDSLYEIGDNLTLL